MHDKHECRSSALLDFKVQPLTGPRFREPERWVDALVGRSPRRSYAPFRLGRSRYPPIGTCQTGNLYMDQTLW